MSQSMKPSIPRRKFMQSAAIGGSLLLAPSATVFGSAANTALQLGVIGCGGRGHNDCSKMIRNTNTRTVALADLFEDRLARFKKDVDERQQEMGGSPIDPSRLYKGPKGYQELLASNVEVVVITSPPYFHPLHLEAAIDAGKHIYCEKPVGVDVFGVNRALKAAEKAVGKQSVMIGFQIRFSEEFREAVKRVHEGAIGDIVCGQVYYHSGRLSPQTRTGASEQENRLRNWVFDKVLSGDIIVEQNVHVIDVGNWYIQNHPIKAIGTGGRKARTDVGDCWDHFIITYFYPNDIKIDFSSTQFLKGFNDCRERIFGTKGVADTGYEGAARITGDNPWTAKSEDPFAGAEERKMKTLEESIRSGKFVNEVKQAAETTLSGILGRIAAYEGREVTWDEMMKNPMQLDAGLKF